MSEDNGNNNETAKEMAKRFTDKIAK